MRSVTDLRRVLARIDVRLTLVLAGMAAAFSAFLLCGFLVFATREALEEESARLGDVARALATTGTPDANGPSTGHGIAFRIRDAGGSIISAGGEWPAGEHVWEQVSFATALSAGQNDYLMRERRTPSGGTVSVALPLRHFAREHRELVGVAAGGALLGLAGALGLGIVGARRALRPLRETTAAIRAIDPGRLEARIALRGTDDDIDALASTTNEVLARLEWAFGRMAAFSADVAHELRTPVNRLLNTAEVALTTTEEPAAKDDALEAIRDTAQALARTIEQLLLLAAGDEGRLQPLRETVDLHAMLADLVGLYAPAAERLGRTIELSPASATLPADRALLERAVANLLDNALKHTAGSARIHVAIETPNGNAVILVEDSGPGIAPGDRRRIFERFVRLDTARGAGGVGLGLSIARMVARLHGGELDVAPSSLGGAAFRLTLARRGASGTAPV